MTSEHGTQPLLVQARNVLRCRRWSRRQQRASPRQGAGFTAPVLGLSRYCTVVVFIGMYPLESFPAVVECALGGGAEPPYSTFLRGQKMVNPVTRHDMEDEKRRRHRQHQEFIRWQTETDQAPRTTTSGDLSNWRSRRRKREAIDGVQEEAEREKHDK